MRTNEELAVSRAAIEGVDHERNHRRDRWVGPSLSNEWYHSRLRSTGAGRKDDGLREVGSLQQMYIYEARRISRYNRIE